MGHTPPSPGPGDTEEAFLLIQHAVVSGVGRGTLSLSLNSTHPPGKPSRAPGSNFLMYLFKPCLIPERI